jgi:nucleotide-binding universal stress UspA family protein
MGQAGNVACVIVCGVDGTDAAANAVFVAASLADALGRPLRLVHAVPAPVTLTLATPAYTYPPQLEARESGEAGERLLERVVHELGASDSVERRVVVGDPASVLRDAAEDDDVELVVVGTRGRGGLTAAVLGSVSSAVVASAPCAVLVVPPLAELGPGPVLCAVDDSAAAREAVRVAQRVCERLGSGLVLAHALAGTPVLSASAVPDGQAAFAEGERERAEELLARLAAELGIGDEVERRIEVGSDAKTIVRLADEAQASLVVIGTRRRGALKSALAGSVSLAVRTSSRRPVLLVPCGARLPLRT